jgi:hypothetical protein
MACRILSLFIFIFFLLATHKAQAQLVPFAFLRSPPASADPCTGTPAVGTTCTGGAKYAGVYNSSKYMVMPGGCADDISDPTCSGTDTFTKFWDLGFNSTPIGANSMTDGQANTNTITTLGSSDYEAAYHCQDMVYGGYNDWFLPARDELQNLYTNRSSLGGFVTSVGGRYWSSTEEDDNNSYHVDFNTGVAAFDGKDNVYYVRCVRKY